MAIGFDQDVVVITGGAGGLGSAYAHQLAERGARVVVNDTGGVVDGRGGNPDAARSVADAITRNGGIAIADTNDGSTVEGARGLIDNALKAFGRIDAVVANAGILRDKTFHKVSDEDFFAVIQAHLYGTVRVFHAAYPHMIQQEYGRLVATTSAAGLFGNFGQTSYAAAKMGIVGLARSLAQEGERKNVKVNVVSPMAATRMTGGLVDETFSRRADPKKVAALVAYLCHSSLDVTGEVFSAGLGRFARVRTGVTKGLYYDNPSPEAIAESFDQLLSDNKYLYLDNVYGEAALVPEPTP